jgi:hypothetical protein
MKPVFGNSDQVFKGDVLRYRYLMFPIYGVGLGVSRTARQRGRAILLTF